ncbi:MAG: class I SAM-dependent methyltransferase, partial [Gemmataceae bacterium]
LSPYLRGHVLEVGAGIGATAALLCRPGLESWTCLEPDPGLAGQMRQRFAGEPLSAPTRVVVGTLADVPPDQAFDTILYIDVLEHIEADGAEMEAAARHLRPGGCLIVLAPAHQRLFTPFDAAIGHYRRYSARTLAAATPAWLHTERLFYLDSVGLIASLANRVLLRQSMPTAGQLRFWDSVLVRLSRLTDPVLGRRVGKTVVGVWRNRR